MWLSEVVEECGRTAKTLTTVDGEPIPVFLLREFNEFMEQVLPEAGEGKDEKK
jgi:hypothetical protein